MPKTIRNLYDKKLTYDSLMKAHYIGKVITKVDFKFIINSKRLSKAKFSIEILEDREIINIVAYDEMADYIYRNVKSEDIIMINGYIEKNKVIIKTNQ